MKKLLLYGTLLAICCAPYFVNSANAGDKGPTEMTMQSTIDPATPHKPAHFPHGAHQARLECKTCHHSKGIDGKRISFEEGQKIEKCETCHHSKAGMPNKISTFKGAAHVLCQSCHRKNKADLVKCGVCHKK